jgi:hypothetical protein
MTTAFCIMENEIWKDIPNYEGYYQVSNLGRIKSLAREVNKGLNVRSVNERILKQSLAGGVYFTCKLYKNGKKKKIKIHQMVAICFLNHVPNGYVLVVNHKNFIKTDNRLENLEIVTQRENTNKKHLKSSSKYVGVCWHKKLKKWMSRICIKGKYKHLGYFEDETHAGKAYENALKQITYN